MTHVILCYDHEAMLEVPSFLSQGWCIEFGVKCAGDDIPSSRAGLAQQQQQVQVDHSIEIRIAVWF